MYLCLRFALIHVVAVLLRLSAMSMSFAAIRVVVALLLCDAKVPYSYPRRCSAPVSATAGVVGCMHGVLGHELHVDAVRGSLDLAPIDCSKS